MFRFSFSPRQGPRLTLSVRLIRYLKTQVTTTKTLADIPGPKGLPFIGTSLEYVRYRDKSHLIFFDRVNSYGKIYQEKMLAGLPRLVSICDPTDIETVLRADGKYPDRPELPLMYEIRDALKIPYGLLLSSDENWFHQRQPISQFMMIPRKVGEYHEGFNHVGRDLVTAIRNLRESESGVVSNIPNLLFKWSFESVAYFTLGKRLGSLDIDNIPKDCLDMIDSTQVFFDAFQKALFVPPIHKIYSTKLWKTLLDSQQKVYTIAMTFIEERMMEVKSFEEQLKHTPEDEDLLLEKTDFLTHMLLKSNLTKEEITSNAVDLLFAGIDTTSYTLCWCLYNLATNSDVQEVLRKEINEVVGERDIVTPEDIHKMSLLRNCVKETLRLYPLVSFNTRKLHSDVILSGYKVPAGIQVIIPMLVIGRLTENFPNEPNSFIPDRWNREGEYPKNPFAFLPFGFGPRMCIGRRIAELEIHTTLAQIIRSLCVQYTDPKPMDYIMKGVLVPERQLNLVFTDC